MYDFAEHISLTLSVATELHFELLGNGHSLFQAFSQWLSFTMQLSIQLTGRNMDKKHVLSHMALVIQGSKVVPMERLTRTHSHSFQACQISGNTDSPYFI